MVDDVFFKIKINGIEFTLFNVYAPNSAKYRNIFFIIKQVFNIKDA